MDRRSTGPGEEPAQPRRSEERSESSGSDDDEFEQVVIGTIPRRTSGISQGRLGREQKASNGRVPGSGVGTGLALPETFHPHPEGGLVPSLVAVLSAPTLSLGATRKGSRAAQMVLILKRLESIAESKPSGVQEQVPSGTSGKVAVRSVSLLPPFVLSDPDSDDDVFIKHTPKSRCRSRQQGPQKCTGGSLLPASLQKEPTASRGSPNSSSCSEGESPSTKEMKTKDMAQILNPKPGAGLGSSSVEEEMDCLILRVKQRMAFPSAQRAVAQMSTTEPRHAEPSWGSPRHAAVKSESALPRLPRSPLPDRSLSAPGPKSKVLADIPQLSWLRLRSSCQVQGCFLQELSDPESQQAKHFQRTKEELAQNLYAFYNHSVFEQKLPERMEIVWSKKMRKTAGCCISSQLKDPAGQRYARIMLSEKVCDSADRLRDTLIHELCHAAAWLLHGVRDGHGRIWSLYAKRSALVHPELPVVSRCHNYEIKYKFVYECSQCQSKIGRHSRSLDTQRFVCALCQGQLVLRRRQPLQKDGSTPANVSLTPFAKYVKENYASAKRSQQQQQQGLSHGAIMKKLSADFAAQAAPLSGP